MSTIKVNKLEQRSGCTATVGGGVGKTVTVDATTVTLGRCGGTVSLACGATQSGFGRTGTVDWCTTAKTAPFTAVSGNGYFVNTTCGAVTVTLPSSPSAGDIISVADYASTWNTNNVTLCRNSSKINGVCANAALNTQGQSVTFVYVDGTRGWKNTMDSTSNVTGENFIVATGGTIVTCGDFKTHIFTGPGTFTVSSLATNPANDVVQYMVVGGGGGSGRSGGGGGAGGWRGYNACSPVSPANGPGALPVSATSYPITIGAGGVGGDTDGATQPATTGSGSTFSTITSAGGGGGGNYNAPGGALPGGSGGGGGAGATPGGSGNTPPTSPAQGTNGGSSSGGSPNLSQRGFGGGGGAVDPGTPGSYPNVGGDGGDGTFVPTSWFGPTAPSYGTPGPVAGRFFAGGGAGAASTAPTVPGGAGGGGNGSGASPGCSCRTAGTANTGGGAGSLNDANGETGGSGIVLIRYKYI